MSARPLGRLPGSLSRASGVFFLQFFQVALAELGYLGLDDDLAVGLRAVVLVIILVVLFC